MATEFVGIELELRGEEGVYNDLKKIQSIMNSLNGRKRIDAGLNEARRQVVAYRGELEKLRREQAQHKKGSTEFKRIAGEIDVVKNKLHDSQQAIREFQQGIREAGKTFQQMATSITSRARQIGGSMQSLGNAMVRMTSPFTRLTTGLLYGAGYKALNMITSGFSGAFERYDTMQNYAKSLKALGLNADQTFKIFEKQDKPLTAIENLNEAVLGLPTGLDEIVAAQKVYAGATGEMVKSTKAAIAANNTFLASGMDARSQRFMQRYLVSLASGAELTTTQWQSMARIAPLAMRAVSEELGYASKDYQKFIADLHRGTIAGEEFLEAFIKVGTDGRVQAAANVMKTTWAGLAANIQNATKRMGEGILKALDDAFVSYNGRNFVQNLLGFDAEGNEIGGGIKHWINGISDAVQGWIRANPDVIMDFFNDLKKIDVKGLITGVAKGFGDIAKAVKWFANAMSGKSLEGVGRWMVRLNLLGRGIGVLGGLIRGLAPLIGRIGAWATVGKGGGLIGKIISIFGGAKGAKGIAETAGSLGTASGSMLTLAKNIGLFAGSIAAVSLAGFTAFRSFKTIVKDLHEAIAEINSFSPGELQMADRILQDMAGAIAGFAVVATMIGDSMGALSLTALAEAPTIIGGVVMAIVGALGAIVSAEVMTIFKSFEQSTKALKDGMSNLEELGNIKFNRKKVDEAIATMKDIQGAFDASYDEGGSAKEGTGKTHADWSANSANFKNVATNISEAIKAIKTSMAELKSLPEISEEDITAATDKVENVIEAMKEIAQKLNASFNTGGGNAIISEGKAKSGGNIVTAISGIIASIKNTISDLKELETLEVELEAAEQNVKEVGEAMGRIFQTLNNAFGNEQVVDYSSDFTRTENEGVTGKQVKNANRMQSLFESYKQTIASIREIYEMIVGGEGDMQFDLDAFNDVMGKISGEEGILAQLKGMYDSLISEEEGFAPSEGGADVSEIMGSFATAIQSIKAAITTLSEIGQIEFEGDGGMAGVIEQIQGAITQLSSAFSTEAIANLQAQVEQFKASIETVKTTLESIGSIGGEEGGAINVDITIVPNITGDTETVQLLETAKTNIETARDAIAKLSQSINLSFPISVSLPGLEAAIARMYNAAARLRAARAALNSARGGTYVATGGYIGANGRVLYRSRGGNVGMKPRGTDTVPAMLTPGEYVHNRKAVDFFGIEFMRKVNHLDVAGAMQELMAKAGHMANVGRQTVINNTYNNNQSVVQNINTNSPDFAFKSASRYVGAF